MQTDLPRIELNAKFIPEPKIKISMEAIHSIQTTPNHIMDNEDDEDDEDDDKPDEDDDKYLTSTQRGRIILGTRVKSLRHETPMEYARRILSSRVHVDIDHTNPDEEDKGDDVDTQY